jgi:hypothetical protein
MNLFESAEEFYESHPQCSKNGYVEFWQNQACGWRNTLRNPETQKAGSLFVSVSEEAIYQCTGGNDQDGAERFVQIV